ncbi:autotransporter outer membrane beta-barrel domain-containing protein [Haloferula sargassicola]|uniref:PEP-CTERM protein-sorting domain-containing protein n=1 Tax=Haloferula sargassicola TaxID=490096 RepID=A0ABP9UQH0_9BACT
MKTPAFPENSLTSRHNLLRTAASCGLGVAGALTALLSLPAQADESWDGEADSDWNNPTNWTHDTFPGGWAILNSTGPNIPTISADSVFTPSDIQVGMDVAGRLDHTAGTAQTGAGNWMTVGFNAGGIGTYNLADTAASGGTLTTFGTGDGTMNVNSNLMIGRGGGTGVVNVNTNGSLNISSDLRITDSGDNSRGTLNIDAGAVNVTGNIQLAKVSGGTGVINVGGGSLSGTELRVGYGSSTGTVNLSAGSISTNGWTTFGGSGASGNLNVSGGTFTQNGAALIIGDGGSGSLGQTGGSLVVNGELMVGQGGGNATQTFGAGTLTTNSWVSVGRQNGTGIVNMTGGTWNHNAATQHLVIGATGTGTVNQSGGLINVATAALEVAENGTGALTLSNTAELRAGVVRVGLNAGATGTTRLNGGTLRTHQISGLNREGTAGAGSSNVYFNGTQIVASGNDSGFITALDTAEIQAGGLKVDSNGFDLSSDQVFTGTGDLVKSGAGSLSLNGDSNFAGTVLVSAGSLYVNGALGGTTSTNVMGDAVIGGNGILAGIISVSGTVSPGNSVGVFGATAMTIDSGGMYLVEIDANGINDRLNITNSLTIDGMIQIYLNYSPSSGDSFDIADFGSFSGTPDFDFTQAPLNPGQSWDTSQFASSGVISVVPEPRVLMLGVLGSLGLLARRRRG